MILQRTHRAVLKNSFLTAASLLLPKLRQPPLRADGCFNKNTTMKPVRKIINDPVYGFITIDHPLILQIMAHPFYQRLRNIHQMAFAHLVYPGAMHSRLHHSLGAYHLMCIALSELKSKGVAITEQEELAAKIAILLHDAGHGPFSHALEHELVPGINHEAISILIMQSLNQEFEGQLTMAIEIFTNIYPKHFLHQLVSGQLDVDRMDYLNRDSFFTGVAEGVIGYDRIIKMLTVKDGELMVEEKGIYSIEKFLVSRRLMYWQVYLHKTVIGAEMMLVKIVRRAKEMLALGEPLVAASQVLDNMLKNPGDYENISNNLQIFCRLDDHDVMATIKNWCWHADKILRMLCRALIDRQLYKVRLQAQPFDPAFILEQSMVLSDQLDIPMEHIHYFIFAGVASNTTYDPRDERINILFKDGTVKDISQVDNALIQHNLSSTVKKHYICYWR